MQATLEQLMAIEIFANLKSIELARLQPCAQVRHYQQGELTFPAKSADSSERQCYDRVEIMTEME